MRVLCLLAPHLPVQVERLRATSAQDRPLIVGGRPWDPSAVLDACPEARRAGVRAGMRLAQAQKLCPQAAFLPSDEMTYSGAHDRLDAVLRTLTDRVETAGLGLLFADVAALRQSPDQDDDAFEQALARRVAEAVRDASPLDARVGLAHQRFTAYQAAHAARPHDLCVVPDSQARAFLAPLPLVTLPAEDEMVRRLDLLGVATLGALARLPRRAVVRQFGADAGPLHDLAAGRDGRGVHPDAPPLIVEDGADFEPPLYDLAPLEAHLTRLCDRLAGDLLHRRHQAQGMALHVEDVRGRQHLARGAVSPPSADPALLARRAAELLSRIPLQSGVAGLALRLYPLRPTYLAATQLSLFTAPASERRRRFQEALRRLRARFGDWVLVIASLVGPPQPRAIQVTVGSEGQSDAALGACAPRALVWGQRIHPVLRIYEHWRERRRWWADPVQRDYFRLELADHQVKVVFRDLLADPDAAWWLERRGR